MKFTLYIGNALIKLFLYPFFQPLYFFICFTKLGLCFFDFYSHPGIAILTMHFIIIITIIPMRCDTTDNTGYYNSCYKHRQPPFTPKSIDLLIYAYNTSYQYSLTALLCFCCKVFTCLFKFCF